MTQVVGSFSPSYQALPQWHFWIYEQHGWVQKPAECSPATPLSVGSFLDTSVLLSLVGGQSSWRQEGSSQVLGPRRNLVYNSQPGLGPSYT